ncbi:hypothetical protein ACGF8B_40805 [Streptomyces sp. NPDC047917]|uniref:hypothetical protein n=1 Tax=Streptomyces sp. NPDC047917 TaxID=3365491 RepID=UPI00371F52AF
MWEPSRPAHQHQRRKPVPGTPANALAELLTAITRRQHEHRQHTTDRLTAALDTGLLPAEPAEGLSARDLARTRIRLEHPVEIETGFPGGSRYRARRHEPRPAFDPVTTRLGERRRTKVVLVLAARFVLCRGPLGRPGRRRGAGSRRGADGGRLGWR